MRLAYIDESGIGNVEQEPHLVVTGVLVHGDGQLLDVKEHLRKIVIKFIPEEHRTGFVFHATELFNGGGKLFDRKNPVVSFEQRLQIIDALAAIPRKFMLKIAQGWVDRRTFPHSFTLPANTPTHVKTMHEHATAFLNCIAMVEMWMRRHAKREHCMTIVEDNSDVRQLLREVQKFNQNSQNLEPDSTFSYLFPFKHIQEDPLFQPKRSASPLEVADFCAYIWRRFLADPENERWVKHIKAMTGCFIDDSSAPKLHLRN
jgi:hypothetical protein